MLADVPYEITALPYYSESWLSREGAALKRRRIEKQGLPDFTNWRFITPTFEGRDVAPELAHKIMSDRMRVWLRMLREAIGEFRWCWKLECHEDGFPHYHVLLEYTKKLDERGMDYISDAWGLGRVNIKRVTQRDIAYVFKYAAKSLELVPSWVLDAPKKIRFFQTSRGFFTAPRKRNDATKKPATFSLLHITHRRRMVDDSRKALIREVAVRGTRYHVVKIPCDFYTWRQHVCLISIALRTLALCGSGVLMSHYDMLSATYENRKHRGLARIPHTVHFASERRSLPERNGSCCAA